MEDKPPSRELYPRRANKAPKSLRIMLVNTKMSQSTTDPVADFLADLTREEVSPQTVKAYRIDLAHFATWFESSLPEPFTPQAVTRTDVRDYRSFLINVEKRQPATVNRRLAALRKFFLWAQAKELV